MQNHHSADDSRPKEERSHNQIAPTKEVVVAPDSPNSCDYSPWCATPFKLSEDSVRLLNWFNEEETNWDAWVLENQETCCYVPNITTFSPSEDAFRAVGFVVRSKPYTRTTYRWEVEAPPGGTCVSVNGGGVLIQDANGKDLAEYLPFVEGEFCQFRLLNKAG